MGVEGGADQKGKEQQKALVSGYGQRISAVSFVLGK